MRHSISPAVLAACLWFTASAAQAQSPRVTNCNDTGPGSLRAVAESAPEGSLVELRSLPCNRIVLTSGPIRLSQYTVGFRGPGWTQLTVSGDGRSQVFVHTPPPPIPFEAPPVLVLQGFTVSWGRALDAEAYGGCIFAGNTLRLQSMQVHHCVARDTRPGGTAGFGGGAFAAGGIGVYFSRIHTNRAEGGNGGGVFTEGRLGADSSHISNNYASGDGGGGEGLVGANITSSSFNRNTAGGRGGGLSVGGGLAWIIRSTIAFNRAHQRGGAQLLPGSSTRLIQSTVSNNVADESQGGVVFEESGSPREILNSTITQNRALAPGARGCRGGGVGVGGSFRINSSIVSGNTCGGVPNDVGMEEVSTPGSGIGGDDNLIGVSTINFFGEGTIFSNNPRLGPLADNGGRTLTHLPLADSPAIDAGNNIPQFGNDQRGSGFPRVKGAGTDIGSVER